ncbi:MAG: phage minor head protein [Pseudomonadota bacterium]
MIVEPHVYRKAFLEYLRKGTPIHLSIKQEPSTSHYIWRTQRDGKVRPRHAQNEGRVFAWDNPPDTGHPGEAPGCRCTAEPYLPNTSEFMTISIANVSGGGSKWTSEDFVRHYFRGNGRGVSVRETGHLAEIVGRYIAERGEALKGQLANEGRNVREGSLKYEFENSYNMTGVVFSVGDTVIGGRATGSVSVQHGIVTLSGEIAFYMEDEFADPIDIGVEVVDPGETIFENIHRPLDDYIRGRAGLPTSGRRRLGVQTGDPYPITDRWSGSFQGRVYLDPGRSSYG